jgi:hypothetical protein
MVPEPISVLDRPGPLRPCFRPLDQPPVLGQRRLDTSEPTSELVAGSSAVAVWVDLCGSTPMTIMDTGSLSLVWVGIRGGQSDFKYLSQQLGVTPLFSHAANADRRDDTPQLGQPEPRVTGFNRVIPCGLLRHAMGCNPTHRPVTLIQVGFNGVSGLTR